MGKMKHASLLLAVVVVLGGIIAGGAGATTTIGAKKERPIVLALAGTSTWSSPFATDTVTGTFTGTVGEDSVSGTYAGHFTLGTSVENPCLTMSAIICWDDISGSFTFTLSGKDGSFTADVEPGGRAGLGGTSHNQEWGFFVDLKVVSGTRSHAPARGQFTLSYFSVTDYFDQPPAHVEQHDSGTLEGSAR
jgi:hypothetical protein